jgi:hypothetical protein
MKMAEETFNRLRELCAAHRGEQCSSMQWGQIRGQVERFVRFQPQMTWEFVGSVGETGVIRNVRSYEAKVRILNSGWTIDSRESNHRAIAHQRAMTLMNLHRQFNPTPFNIFWLEGATEALFNGERMWQAMGRIFQ